VNPISITEEEALALAIKEAGGPAAVARFITKNYGKITAQSVCGWAKCPPRRALQLEAACSGKVTRHQLARDLYPPEQTSLPLAAATG
jgi:DNA-binding transcriptional regulator YdaS (Cro superfamily)